MKTRLQRRIDLAPLFAFRNVQCWWITAIVTLGLVIWATGFSIVKAQGDDPLAVLRLDTGIWKAEMKMWLEPGAEPQTFQGEETNRMLGDHWSVCDFKGEIMGQAFEGHSTFGYDAESQKYVGFWADSMSPHSMHMSGTWDAAAQTMTMFGEGKNLQGQPEKSKSVLVHKNKDTRHFTMYVLQPGSSDQYNRTMEIIYTRKK